MTSVYVLALEGNKFYVGRTNDVAVRLEQHRMGRGSAWTTKYRFKDVVEIIPNCDNFDEDKITRKYMSRYGIDNVRGGAYCQIELPAPTIKVLQQEIYGANNRCFKCGGNHFVQECPVEEKDALPPEISDEPATPLTASQVKDLETGLLGGNMNQAELYFKIYAKENIRCLDIRGKVYYERDKNGSWEKKTDFTKHYFALKLFFEGQITKLRQHTTLSVQQVEPIFEIGWNGRRLEQLKQLDRVAVKLATLSVLKPIARMVQALCLDEDFSSKVRSVPIVNIPEELPNPILFRPKCERMDNKTSQCVPRLTLRSKRNKMDMAALIASGKIEQAMSGYLP